MKKLTAIAVLGVSSLFAATAQAQLQNNANAEQIMQCVRANVPQHVAIRNITVLTTGRDGNTTEMSARVYATRETVEDGTQQMRAMLRVDRPASLAGAAYLVRETDDFLRDAMFVYLPAVGRVRRISGQFGNASLLGTDFSYYDFKQLTNAFGDLQGNLEGRAAIEGRPAFAMRFTPLPGTETEYTSVRAWVDQRSCLVVKAEFREGEQIIKRMIAPVTEIEQHGEHWYLGEIEMSDLTRGTKTVMQVDEITVDEELADARFNPRSFYRVP